MSIICIFAIEVRYKCISRVYDHGDDSNNIEPPTEVIGYFHSTYIWHTHIQRITLTRLNQNSILGHSTKIQISIPPNTNLKLENTQQRKILLPPQKVYRSRMTVRMFIVTHHVRDLRKRSMQIERESYMTKSKTSSRGACVIKRVNGERSIFRLPRE